MANCSTSLKIFYSESAVEWTVLDTRFHGLGVSTLNTVDMDPIPSASALASLHVITDVDIAKNLRDVVSCLAEVVSAQHDHICTLKAEIDHQKSQILTLQASNLTLKAANLTLNKRLEALKLRMNRMDEQMKEFTSLQQVDLRKLIERVRDKGRADMQQAGIACPTDWNAAISQPRCVAALQQAGLDEGLMITRYGSGSEQEYGNEAAHEISESMCFYANLVCKHQGTKLKQYTNCFKYLFGRDPEELASS